MGLLDLSRYLVGTGSEQNCTAFLLSPTRGVGEVREGERTADGVFGGDVVSGRPRLSDRDLRLTVEVMSNEGDSQNLTWYEMTNVL